MAKERRRRLRKVEAEDCPRCGAKIGDRCRNWKGGGCAPHAIGDKEPASDAATEPGPGEVLQQDTLFPEGETPYPCDP